MKVVVLLSRFPYPLEKGDKLRAYHQVKHLNQKYEVILCCLTNKVPSSSEINEVNKICSELHWYKLNKIKQSLRLVYALISSKPYQVHFFYQKPIAQKIKRLLEDRKPDHIYTQLIRTTEYVKHLHEVPKTLDYMDALNKNYSRRLKELKGIKHWFTTEEANRLVAYENLIFDYFEHHIIISEQDKKLIYHEKREKIKVVPNGVDMTYFKKIKNTEKSTDLLFTGNMGYAPNESAALFLINEVLPKIHDIDPEVTLTIAGANPSAKLRSNASTKIKITGWIDDLREVFSSSKIFVAPMLQGTGLQNKLLEAMSMEIPCVTSKLANNALGAEPNKEIFVFDNTEHLVSLLIHLLNESDKRDEIANAGKQFIEQNYSWESANEKLEELLVDSL